MYIVFAKRIGQCDIEMFSDESWDHLKIRLVKEFGPEFHKAMDHSATEHVSAWSHLRQGDTVIFYGEMLCLYQEEKHGERYTLFANKVIVDISEYDL